MEFRHSGRTYKDVCAFCTNAEKLDYETMIKVNANERFIRVWRKLKDDKVLPGIHFEDGFIRVYHDTHDTTEETKSPYYPLRGRQIPEMPGQNIKFGDHFIELLD